MYYNTTFCRYLRYLFIRWFSLFVQDSEARQGETVSCHLQASRGSFRPRLTVYLFTFPHGSVIPLFCDTQNIFVWYVFTLSAPCLARKLRQYRIRPLVVFIITSKMTALPSPLVILAYLCATHRDKQKRVHKHHDITRNLVSSQTQ